jgi:ribonuclease P/MRP protein subunit POP5
MNTLPAPKGGSSDCVMRVVRVSGTIRKAEEEAMRRARESMRRAVAQEGGSWLAGLNAMSGESLEAGTSVKREREDDGDVDMVDAFGSDDESHGSDDSEDED